MESVGDYEYYTKDLIGHGAFAVVFKGRHKKHHDQVVAIKSVPKKNINKSQQFLGKEIKILQEVTKLHHKNVVALLECVETPQKLYIVIEFCNGGDLSEYLNAKGTLSEDTIRLFLRQIAEAVKVLNAKGVVHRDLKPQNILLCHSGKPNPSPAEITLKIADFGFARFLQDGVMAATLCGSPMYMAPEVIMSLKYDAKADLWSIGTIVFQCLTGKAPFMAPNPPALKQFYEKNANLAPKIPRGTSPELTELLLGLMKRDAKDRIDFDQFFNHPFLKVDRPRSSSPVPVPVPTRRSMSPERMSPCSPVSPCSSPSPQCWEREIGGEDMAPCASPLVSSPMEGSKLFQSEVHGDSSSSAFEQDFVVIPRNVAVDAKDELNQNMSPKPHDHRRSPSRSPVCNPAFRKSGQAPNINLAAKAVSYQAMITSSTDDSSRPSSLPMTTGTNSTVTTTATSPYSYHCSEAVPVPSAPNVGFEELESSPRISSPASSPHRDYGQAKRRMVPPASPSSPKDVVVHSDPISMRRDSTNSSIGSETNKMADVSSFTPPAVQFTIGTPPSGGRLRSYSSGGATPPPSSGWRQQTTPPHSSVCGSPLKRSGNTPTPPAGSVPVSSSSLSPVLGSPNKELWRADHHYHHCHTEPALAGIRAIDYRNVNSPHCPLRNAFGGRTRTLPDIGMKDLWPSGPIQEADDQECFLQRSGSSGKLNDTCGVIGHFAFGGTSPSPPGAAIMPYSHQQFHQHAHQPHHCYPYNTPSCQHPCWNCVQSSRSRRCSGGAYMDSSPTFLYGNSPQSTESQQFIAPELTEETLLEKEHNETLAKLNFVSALVKCILELAKTSSSPISAALSNSVSRTEGTNPIKSEGYQQAVQLLLYMKALQLLSSSLHLSQQEVKQGHLQPSASVRSVLHDMKEQYHLCVSMCKSLNTPGLLQSVGVDPTATNLTADKILYSYAIEMCQSAALEELFGEPKESFRRYQTAQILLHSLSQQINDANDKELLHKYRNAVEKRLTVLSNYGYALAYDTQY